jgi:hypothetical protein
MSPPYSSISRSPEPSFPLALGAREFDTWAIEVAQRISAKKSPAEAYDTSPG